MARRPRATHRAARSDGRDAARRGPRPVPQRRLLGRSAETGERHESPARRVGASRPARPAARSDRRRSHAAARATGLRQRSPPAHARRRAARNAPANTKRRRHARPRPAAAHVPPDRDERPSTLRYQPAPGAGRPTARRSRRVQSVDRREIEVERIAVHRSEQRLRGGTTIAPRPQLGLRTLHRQPSHQRCVRLTRPGRSAYALKRTPKLSVRCHGDAWMLARHETQCSSAELHLKHLERADGRAVSLSLAPAARDAVGQGGCSQVDDLHRRSEGFGVGAGRTATPRPEATIARVRATSRVSNAMRGSKPASRAMRWTARRIVAPSENVTNSSSRSSAMLVCVLPASRCLAGRTTTSCSSASSCSSRPRRSASSTIERNATSSVSWRSPSASVVLRSSTGRHARRGAREDRGPVRGGRAGRLTLRARRPSRSARSSRRRSARRSAVRAGAATARCG